MPLGAVAVGVAVHRLGHFLHEGAHFNLAPIGMPTIALTNAVVGVVVLTDVRAYRPIHLAHHRKLGQPDDPERSYFEALDGRFVFRGLLGTRVRFRAAPAVGVGSAGGPRAVKLVPMIGAGLHAAIALGLLRRGRRATASPGRLV